MKLRIKKIKRKVGFFLLVGIVVTALIAVVTAFHKKKKKALHRENGRPKMAK